MKHLDITARGTLSISDDDWERFRRGAQECGVSTLQYLKEEPGLWWRLWEDDADHIEIEEID